MSDAILEKLCERLAGRINDEVPSFEDFDVRADAGEPGLVYVALRGAKREKKVGERFADRVADVAEGVLEQEDEAFGFALSIGAGMRDLLLQIEVRQATS